jgi:hypothetical protein
MRLEGTVYYGLEGSKQQFVRITPDRIECCGLERELGRPCSHAVALLREASRRRHPRFHAYFSGLDCHQWLTETWASQYETPPIALGVHVESLLRDQSIHPWKKKPVIGRPPKEKVIVLKESTKNKTCRGCGKMGHNIRSCTNVDLDFYFDQLSSTADQSFFPDEDEEEDEDNDDGDVDDGYDLYEDEDEDEGNDNDSNDRHPKTGNQRRSRGAEFVAAIEAAQEDPSSKKRPRVRHNGSK